MNKYRGNSREKMLSLKNKILVLILYSKDILVSVKELSDNSGDENQLWLFEIVGFVFRSFFRL